MLLLISITNFKKNDKHSSFLLTKHCRNYQFTRCFSHWVNNKTLAIAIQIELQSILSFFHIKFKRIHRIRARAKFNYGAFDGWNCLETSNVVDGRIRCGLYRVVGDCDMMNSVFHRGQTNGKAILIVSQLENVICQENIGRFYNNFNSLRQFSTYKYIWIRWITSHEQINDSHFFPSYAHIHICHGLHFDNGKFKHSVCIVYHLAFVFGSCYFFFCFHTSKHSSEWERTAFTLLDFSFFFLGQFSGFLFSHVTTTKWNIISIACEQLEWRWIHHNRISYTKPNYDYCWVNFGA